MARGLYCKLALRNLKNNRRVTLPYLLSGAGIILMFYCITALSLGIDAGGHVRRLLRVRHDGPGGVRHRPVRRAVPVLHQQLPHQAPEKGDWAFTTSWAWRNATSPGSW